MMPTEQLTRKLMLHPIAADTYATIDAKTDPERLADIYCRLLSHAEYRSHAYALGIEAHLRTLAQLRFNNVKVLRALDTIERALAHRGSHGANGSRAKRETAHNRILAENRT